MKFVACKILYTRKCISSQLLSKIKLSLHHCFRQTVAICLVLPVRWLSDGCQLPARCPLAIDQLQPNICQTSTTYTPDIYTICTSTSHPPEIYQTSIIGSTADLPDIHHWWIYILYVRCLVYFWYMSGVYVVLVWQMSDWSWQMSGGASGRHLTFIWQEAPDK